MSNTQELLPCPFCGSKNIQRSDNAYGAFWTMCDDCGACTGEGDVANQDEADARWNTRALPPAAMGLLTDEPQHGTMKDFAAAADLVDKLGQAKTKGEMLGLVLRYRKEVRAAMSAPQAVPEGWKLVPVVPTEAMHVAAVRTAVHCTGNDDFPPRVYAAMLAAAPQESAR
jgi:hypothetical protein